MRRLKERTLLYRLEAHRDPDAYGELYDEYVSRIYRFIFFKVKSAQDAEDLTADVFLKTWQHITEEREIHNFNSLIYRIARNTVADYYRNMGKEVSLDERAEAEIADIAGTSELPLYGATGLSAVNHAVNQEIQAGPDESQEALKKDMLKAMGKLKDEYREVLVMRFIDGMSVAETAKALDRSSVSVRVLQHRAMKAMQRILENGNGSSGRGAKNFGVKDLGAKSPGAKSSN